MERARRAIQYKDARSSRGGGSHTVAGFAADKTRHNELIEHEQKVKEIQEEMNDSEIECVGVRFFNS